MELLQIRYFLEVARSGHVTEAARNLHVTQSSLSKTIQRLEEDLGVPLFDRIGRRLRLNEYGSLFLQRAERALFELEQGRKELSDRSGPAHGTLELAVNTASMLPNLLRAFRMRQPDVHFHVQMLTTQEMVTQLLRGAFDYCLSSPPLEGEDIESTIVYVDPILVAVPKGHRLAGRSSVALAELKDEWFVGVRQGYGTRDLVDSLCQEAGFVPRYVYEGDEPARISALVEAEIGIAFMPGTARYAREQLVFLPIENEGLKREIALVRHKSRYISRAAAEFREVVISHFKELST